MTYEPHVLLQWGGDLTAGEIWSNGLRIDLGVLNAAGRQNWCEAAITDCSNDVSAFVARAASHLGTKCKLRFVKLNPIGPDGRYESEDGTVARYYNTVPYPSGTGGVYLPHQCATVATLATDHTRGRASHGRIYLPTASIGIQDSNQQMSAADAIAIADSVKTLVNDLNNLPGLDILVGNPQVCVYSALGSPGPHRAVTHIEVDERLDVQRRRANSAITTRHVVAL